MKLKISPYGYYDAEHLDSREVTLFMDREYYPFYAVEERRENLLHGEGDTSIIKIVKDIYGYFKFRFNYSVFETSSYSTLFRYMLERKKFFKHFFKYKGEDIYVFCVRGTIYSSEGEMLFSLATDSLEFIIEDGEFPRFDYRTFKMFMSTKLLQEEKYSFFYKKFFAEFITLFLNEGVELRVTSQSLEDIFYKNHSVEQDFRSVAEIHTFLKKDILEYLFFDENDYSPKSLFETHSVDILNLEPEIELRKAVRSEPSQNNLWVYRRDWMVQADNSTDRLNQYRNAEFESSYLVTPIWSDPPSASFSTEYETTEEEIPTENNSLPGEFSEENFIN